MELFAYVHSQNIIHTDFHPGNIQLGKNGKIYLLDYGNSMILKDGVFNPKVQKRKGSYCGGPEVYDEEKKYSFKADVFTIACWFTVFQNEQRNDYFSQISGVDFVVGLGKAKAAAESYKSLIKTLPTLPTFENRYGE
jgi:serine/threonine protein kinase